MSAVMIRPVQAVAEIRKSIQDLEDSLLSLPEEYQLDPDLLVEHHFAPGVYVRQMFMPAGLVVTGKVHKTEHVSIISSGTVTVATENEGSVTIEGPYTFINHIGDKRAVYAHTEVVWSTIHPNPTDERDISKLEAEIVECPSE